MIRILKQSEWDYLCSRVEELKQEITSLKKTNKGLLRRVDSQWYNIRFLQHLTRPIKDKAKEKAKIICCPDIRCCPDICFMCKHKRHIEGVADVYYCKKKADIVGATKNWKCECFEECGSNE